MSFYRRVPGTGSFEPSCPQEISKSKMLALITYNKHHGCQSYYSSPYPNDFLELFIYEVNDDVLEC